VEERMDVKLHHSVHGPGRTSDKPNPVALSHGWRFDAGGGV
jgi:hypothetical protein